MSKITINGMTIVSSPFLTPRPRLKLGESAQVSQHVREDFDKFLLDMFGTKDEIMVVGSTCFVTEDQMTRLVAQSSELGVLRV